MIATPLIAHLLEGAAPPQWWPVLIGAAVAALMVQHSVVKHRVAETGLVEPARLGRIGALGVGVIVLSAVATPVVQAGQATNGLPDLISDPPRPSILKEIVDETGDTRLVLTFDGYIHNIGDGPLDVIGNPQEADGMVQRVREGGEWREVSRPTVRFENDDGHNHFHLIEAIDYVLWNEDLGEQTAPGSKVGFCLVDSEQMEPGADQGYSEELDNFCQQDNPGATNLRMGISPGWRDTYDASTTLQWIDVSDIAPGRYWIGAITDERNEIVESNEENNKLIFSQRPAIVPGWLPVGDEVSSDGAAVQIELRARPFGTTGPVSFAIVEGPTSGTLDVPTGATTNSSTVLYTPDAGFSGTDRIVFSARDGASPYPSVAPTAEVIIDVTEAGEGLAEAGPAPRLLPESTFFELQVGEPFSTPIATLSSTGTPVRVYAAGLPAGLRIDEASIVGTAVSAGFTEVELVGVDANGGTTTQPITIIVNDPEAPRLAGAVDRSSPLDHLTQIQLGARDLASTYRASGVPPGLALDEAAPVISGTPTETGTWQVEVTQTAADGVTSTSAFTWTVRPAIAIRFPL